VIELSRHVFETLRKDQEFVLYRGRSIDDASQILLLSPVTVNPRPVSLKRLQHEYSLRDTMDPAWSARPIAMAYYSDRPVLVLEDPGGVPLDRLLSDPLDLARSLRLAIGLSTVIERTHQRGIIHKDIKPPNVLANFGTGQCWLTGFGIASQLPRERHSAEPPEFLAGTLAYMAPEQTGRMNRSIDSRSDLYALGVTLYEMLTGSLPFKAADPMEWVHCHIARQPVPPDERLKNIPGAVSAIVMKLLAKTAEERYQTAAGVESDLRRCLAEWEGGSASASLGQGIAISNQAPADRSGGAARLSSPKSSPYRIDEFLLGQHDTPDRLLIPEKLYGRVREIDTLLASFERVVASGTPELVLVSGYAGIGKSSLVNELHKVLVLPRGLFASGKFDQYKRDIPYSTLAQALQGLIRPLLAKSDAELHNWGDAFRAALEPNGQLIVDLVPELKLIIGEQPPVPGLPPKDAQGRFQLVFRRFLGVFARREHPLALFLDDLQWIDTATLDLLEDLFTWPDPQHLMLIGAYRDNEVNGGHPLMRKLSVIRQTPAKVQEIILAPLASQDLGQLIADSLYSAPEHVTPLAQLVHEKTGGNPFFAIQFIHTLADEGLITFDHTNARWSWDLKQIHAKGYTDNVVDLMVGKLNRLPVTTQETLKDLACLGNVAKTTTLSIVHGTSEEVVHSDLWEALRPELIVRSENSYSFAHDRVHEATYSLIPYELRAEAHLRIGRLLAAHTPPDKREEAIFEIVNQLNCGATLVTSSAEREQIAEFNLMAGKRAKASGAYGSALKYLIDGAAFLADDCWERRHDLVFQLESHRAECEFLTGELASAAERLARLSSHAVNTFELATAACLQIEVYTTLGQSDGAVAVCLDYLRRLGVDWSAHPTDNDVRQEYERIWGHIGARPIEQLVDLPLTNDPICKATLDVLSVFATPAWYTDKNLHDLVVAHMANLSLEHGNSDGSCYAYALLGRVLGSSLGQYQAGFRFGKLGVDLVEKRGLDRFKASVYNAFGHHIIPWTRHLQDGRVWNRRAFKAAKESGDLTFAAFSYSNMIANLLAGGDPLEEVQQEAANGLELVQKMRFGLVSDYITVQLRLIRTLRGLTPKFGSFNDAEFDESRFEQHLEENPRLAEAACRYWIQKLQARFYADDYVSAVGAASKAHQLLKGSESSFDVAGYPFYSALAHAAFYSSASVETRLLHREALAAHQRQLDIWAENCPENFENRAALVNAEAARIEGRELDAEHLYEQAIRSAHVNGFVHNEALANELAARFYLARGLEKIGHAYLRDARYCYLRWGAAGKVRQLDELYPHLREEEAPSGLTSTIGAPVEQLDLATVIKVSQAVSGEIVLETLIDALMRTAIEHAGAQRGLLILPRGTEQRIEAEATTSGDTIIVRLRVASLAEAAVPESIIHYVARTRESVILDDASARNLFSEDEYIRQQHPRSILCLPLVKQAKLMGLLYLENNLAPRVFTTKRLAMLELLASQAAISLDHARLYADLIQENNDRKKAEEALRQKEVSLHETQSELAHVGRVTTMGELAASIAHEVSQPLVGVVANASASLRLLAGNSPNLAEACEAIRAILRDGNRAADVISRMRALFKKARPAKERLNINEAIEEVVILTQGEARRNKVALRTELAADLPAVMADRVQIQQVVMNLILNGIEAMSTVENRARDLVIRTQSSEGNEIHVSVQDSGIGFDPLSAARIFDAFHSTKPGGMGMGLTISRSIVESHGGQLWATSNDGPGATFQFTL